MQVIERGAWATGADTDPSFVVGWVGGGLLGGANEIPDERGAQPPPLKGLDRCCTVSLMGTRISRVSACANEHWISTGFPVTPLSG